MPERMKGKKNFLRKKFQNRLGQISKKREQKRMKQTFNK